MAKSNCGFSGLGGVIFLLTEVVNGSSFLFGSHFLAKLSDIFTALFNFDASVHLRDLIIANMQEYM
jgi:hypothetical protein